VSASAASSESSASTVRVHLARARVTLAERLEVEE
jgi:hypothetical protein